MTPDEAKIKLDRDDLLKRRNQSRMFGNIDSNINPLSDLEIFDLVLIEKSFLDRVTSAFTSDSLYKYLKEKK